MVTFGRILGLVLVLGIIGPLFWLGVNMLENKLASKGFKIANFDLFSWRSWRSVLIKIRDRRRQ